MWLFDHASFKKSLQLLKQARIQNESRITLNTVVNCNISLDTNKVGHFAMVIWQWLACHVVV
jgi:hypothetical protein